MSTGPSSLQKRGSDQAVEAVQGVALLAAIVGVMWLVEIINVVDSYRLDSDGIHARDLDRIWGIVTAPFLHASWPHLIGNTIPLVFMGLIIAMRGAIKLAIVTTIVVLVGGLGTWLIAPAGSTTVGASGLVFGYATYLLTRGIFDRSVLELLTGGVVGAVWGGALLASLVPHTGVSWQAHLCGAVAGVIAAAVLARPRERAGRGPGAGSGPGGGGGRGSGSGGRAGGGGGGSDHMSALDRALAS
jgi:membrane associated rhomboid family serine protease